MAYPDEKRSGCSRVPAAMDEMIEVGGMVMVICIFGESCTGKSTLAEALSGELNAKIYTGKDYLRMDKDEAKARELFKRLLEEERETNLIYVVSEPEHLELIPENSFRILATCELGTIKNRFAQRMRGNLPDPVEKMIERKHGLFDKMEHHHHIHESSMNLPQLLDVLKRH